MSKPSIDINSLPTISIDEVHKHKEKGDCWTVVDDLVYNVTSYIPYHPGGKKIMLGAGKEASKMFRKCNQSRAINGFYGLLICFLFHSDRHHPGVKLP